MARYFVLQDKVLDTELPILLDEAGNQVQLEPKIHQLLLYFCQHPQQVVSRDEIIQHINKGVVVSDNAVNKMVAKARQMLQDDPKNPRFIKTIPKQGYCFVAGAVLSSTAKLGGAISANSHKTKWGLLVSIPFVLIALLLLLFRDPEPPALLNSKIVPMTNQQGVEFAPNLSPNGEMLAYVRHSPQLGIHQWWLSDTGSSTAGLALPINNKLSPIAWYPDSERLLYVEYEGDSCQVKRLNIVGAELASESVFDCGKQVISQLLLAPDDKSFYFVMRESFEDPWLIYFYDASSGLSLLIEQPEAVAFGNYSIDLSPQQDKLLILASGAQKQTRLFQLHLAENELSLLSEWPWLMSRAIWHHDNKSIVHTSSRYSHELVQSTVAGKKLSTIASTAKRVAENFRRHSNQVDFYFSSFQMNNDIQHYLAGNRSPQSFNSDVYDKLPTYAGSGDAWYMVSNRGGLSQIYYVQEATGALSQVSKFELDTDIFSLDASPSGRYILFNSFGHFTILDRNNGTSINKSLDEGSGILAIDWLTEDEIAITTSRQGDLQLLCYQVSSDTMQKEDLRWQAMFTSPSGAKTFAIATGDNHLYQLDRAAGTAKPLGLKLDEIYSHTGLAVKATETSLVYSKLDGQYSRLHKFHLATGQSTVLGQWLFLGGFDVRADNLLVSFEANRTGDVVMTQLIPAS